MHTVAVVVCALGDNYPYSSANSDAAMHSARDSGRIRIRRYILAGNSDLNCNNLERESTVMCNCNACIFYRQNAIIDRMSYKSIIYVYDCFQNINLDMRKFNIAENKLYFKCLY